jgi:hypothetical protein
MMIIERMSMFIHYGNKGGIKCHLNGITGLFGVQLRLLDCWLQIGMSD